LRPVDALFKRRALGDQRGDQLGGLISPPLISKKCVTRPSSASATNCSALLIRPTVTMA